MSPPALAPLPAGVLDNPGRAGTGALIHPAALRALAPLLGSAGREERGPRWQDRALCAETDPEAFFPEKGGSTREAKQVCRSCEVRAECLAYALEHDERFGVWGGLSERERRLKERAGDAPEPVLAGAR